MSWLDQMMFGYRSIQIGGVTVPPETTLNFTNAVTAVDNPGQQRTDVTIGGVNGTLSASSIFSVTDAGLTIVATSGWVYVYSTAAFTLDRTLTLPVSTSNPAAGMIVTWSDDATTANGSLASHNLIINGNGNNVQYSTTRAATITASLGGSPTQVPVGPGGSITLIFNGTYWKVQ